MIRLLTRNIVRFLILVALQVLVLNNIQLSGYINPYFYILFILLMPFETPPWVGTVVGFLLGLSIDMFANTPGLHAASTAFMGFVRPYFLRYISPRDGYEPGSFPRVFYYGFNWFLKYSFLLVFIHHSALFFLEAFSFAAFGHVIMRIIFSTLFSVSLIMMSQYLVFRK
ncbi:MAG: rod shape-determining protein MreD [Salinivirgaceae bacterium]